MIKPGRPYPLGASWDGLGANFALFSENADKVELCLFDSAAGGRESARLTLPEREDQVWHGYVPSLRPGQLYAYRVSGPDRPSAGHRFDPSRLLLDPYAKGLVPAGPGGAALGALIDGAFDWGGDAPPRTPWHKTLIYELHVKGFSRLHPGVSEPLRGTYAGLASKESLAHLLALGVTAVELMPVHAHYDEPRLREKGLSNYWGYNTLSYFAPEPSYSHAALSRRDPLGAIPEFKAMVKALHAAGLEVILDVVYNHTAEGDHQGPTLSWRGIDNAAYYRLDPKDNGRYLDFTGCGNTLNMTHPRALQMIMDSLRYWVLEMRVDGFRFDLASALARELYEVDRLGAFFDIIHQDPVLSQVKLIAEPWDLGHGGYQVGNFPVLWTEWNGRYRDAVRRFWKGDGGAVAELATRLAGSSDLYGPSGRKPHASINFVTCHDGFTLQDLVSYEKKRNEANLDGGKDGEDHNLSSNGGAEGPSGDPAVVALRERQKRNLLATLFLSQGVPMLRGGDELSQTQLGNNNAYCHDSPLSWLDWGTDERRRAFLDFARCAASLWASHPVLRRRKFFQGRPLRGSGVKDIHWLTPEGREMSDADWAEPAARRLAVFLAGDAIDELGEDGEPVRGESLLLLFNAHPEPCEFSLPGRLSAEGWELLLDTAGVPPAARLPPGPYRLEGLSLAVLKARP